MPKGRPQLAPGHHGAGASIGHDTDTFLACGCWEFTEEGEEYRISCDEHALGTGKNLQMLARLLEGWRCCGSPSLCGARCQDDELSATLAQAERLVREACPDA